MALRMFKKIAQIPAKSIICWFISIGLLLIVGLLATYQIYVASAENRWPNFITFLLFVLLGTLFGGNVSRSRKTDLHGDFSMAVFDFVWVASSIAGLLFIYKETYVATLIEPYDNNLIAKTKNELSIFKSGWIVVWSALLGLRLAKAIYDLKIRLGKIGADKSCGPIEACVNTVRAVGSTLLVVILIIVFPPIALVGVVFVILKPTARLKSLIMPTLQGLCQIGLVLLNCYVGKSQESKNKDCS